jgi:hypothetical protein
MHPRVRAEEARRAAAFASDATAVVVTDAALLVESGVHLRFHRLVVVHCRPEEQLARLMRRDRLTEAAARARIQAQMPAQEKRRFAHYDIDSSGPVEWMDRDALQLAGELRALAATRPAAVSFPLERAVGTLAHGPSGGRAASTRSAFSSRSERLVASSSSASPECWSPGRRAVVPGGSAPSKRALHRPVLQVR